MGRTMSPLLLVCVLVLSGCGDAPTADSATEGGAERFPMTVETCGREVTLEREPARVMTVGAEAPTLLWAAGAADEVDVRAADFGSPLGAAEAAFENVPLISPDESPSKEVTIGQEPDLLLGYGLTTTPWQDLDAVGIDQIVVSGQCDSRDDDGPTLDRGASFQDIYDDIELYGRIFGTENVATRAVAYLRERVAAIEERFQGAPGRTAAVVAAYPGHLSVYGQASISQVQLKTLGLTNVFADVDQRYIELSVEELLARDPDVLIVASEHGGIPDVGVQRVRELPGAGRLTALREGHIVPVDGQTIIGGTQPIEKLDDMADTLAGFG